MAHEEDLDNNAEGELEGPDEELCGVLETAWRIGSHAEAAGDLRGAWEVFSCAARLAVITCDDAIVSPLTEALHDGSLLIHPQEQIALLRQAYEAVLGGPLEAGPAPGAEENPEAEARSWIEQAISIGAPAYNEGDHRGCYEVYACTARLILRGLPQAEKAQTQLREALRRCGVNGDVDATAWIMRRAFDSLLTPPVSGTRKMRALLEQAISIGAPAYNEGDHRGCYEVYACTARLILATMQGCEPARQCLQEALDRCQEMTDPNQQAWTLRHAFDCVLTSERGEEEDEADVEPE